MPEISLAADLDWIDRLAYLHWSSRSPGRLKVRREAPVSVDLPPRFPGDRAAGVMRWNTAPMIRWPMDDKVSDRTDMPSAWNPQKYSGERGNRA